MTIQQRFKNERQNVFVKKINKIAFISNNDKRRQSVAIETNAYRTSKDLVSEKEKIKCNSITKRYKT